MNRETIQTQLSQLEDQLLSCYERIVKRHELTEKQNEADKAEIKQLAECRKQWLERLNQWKY